MPSACEATRFKVAPTVNVSEPELNVPVVAGVLVKVSTIIWSVPLVMVTDEGNVMAYVYESEPETVKEAAVTVPVFAGKVTPPVNVRPLAGDKTTVPTDPSVAILPKFISVFLEILMGVTIVADTLAVAVACAKIEDVKKRPRKQKPIVVIAFFIMKRIKINKYLEIKTY